MKTNIPSLYIDHLGLFIAVLESQITWQESLKVLPVGGQMDKICEWDMKVYLFS